MAKTRELTKESAEKWLDGIIKLQNQYENKRHFNDNIIVCSMANITDVHIFSGIEQLAYIFGAELQSRPWDVEGSAYTEELYFNYKNCEIHQIGKTDEK